MREPKKYKYLNFIIKFCFPETANPMKYFIDRFGELLYTLKLIKQKKSMSDQNILGNLSQKRVKKYFLRNICLVETFFSLYDIMNTPQR